MPEIKITEITLFYDEPLQGFCEVDGERLVWETDEPKDREPTYKTFRLSDEEWEVVSRQPSDDAGLTDLVAIYTLMRARGHVHTFGIDDAEWPPCDC